MRLFGTLNDRILGDTLANCMNATKSSNHRTDGKGALRSSKQKRGIRTQMNQRTRQILKRELIKNLHYDR